MKKKNARYPEAESLSMDAMKCELETVKKKLSELQYELERMATVYPLIENIIETSIKIIRSRKIG